MSLVGRCSRSDSGCVTMTWIMSVILDVGMRMTSIFSADINGASSWILVQIKTDLWGHADRS